jgi:hypothetical protein
MPKKIQNFAKSTLVRAIIVNVGRAGAGFFLNYSFDKKKIFFLI